MEAESDLVLMLSMRCCILHIKIISAALLPQRLFRFAIRVVPFFCPGSLLLRQTRPRARRSPSPSPCAATGLGVHDAGI